MTESTRVCGRHGEVKDVETPYGYRVVCLDCGASWPEGGVYPSMCSRSFLTVEGAFYAVLGTVMVGVLLAMWLA